LQARAHFEVDVRPRQLTDARNKGAPHDHEWPEIIYVVSGVYRAKVSGPVWTGQAGDLIYYPPRFRHQGWFAGSEATRILAMQWRGGELWPAPFRHHDGSGRLLLTLLWMCDLTPPRTGADSRIRDALLEAFLHELRGQLEQGSVAQDPVSQALRFIHRDIVQITSLNELANMAQVTPSHLAHLFKARMGCGPIQYLRRHRLECALNLIVSTRLPLKEIAASTGFCYAFHLSKLIHRQFGRPPRAFRGASAGAGDGRVQPPRTPRI
jgi:AraC-like DNA-binding protein